MSYKINILRWFAIAADVREALELLKSVPGDTIAAKLRCVISDLASLTIERDNLRARLDKYAAGLAKGAAASAAKRAASKPVSDVVEKGL